MFLSMQIAIWTNHEHVQPFSWLESQDSGAERMQAVASMSISNNLICDCVCFLYLIIPCSLSDPSIQFDFKTVYVGLAIRPSIQEEL
jgi:hypothetical protein